MSRCYHHIFQVEADTVEGEVVAVTGSSGELGRWRRNSVLPLVRQSEHRCQGIFTQNYFCCTVEAEGNKIIV